MCHILGLIVWVEVWCKKIVEGKEGKKEKKNKPSYKIPEKKGPIWKKNNHITKD